MALSSEILAYAKSGGRGAEPIKRQLVIELDNVWSIKNLAYSLSFSIQETIKDFDEAIDRYYSAQACAEADSFRMLRLALMDLKRIYEEETGKSADDDESFMIPE